MNRCVQYTCGQTIKTNRTKCIFKRNLNPILIFSWFVPKRGAFRSSSHSRFLSRSISCRFTPAQSPFPTLSLLLRSSTPAASHLHRRFHLTLLPSSLFSSQSFPSGSGRATSSSLLSAASRNHSRWNRG